MTILGGEDAAQRSSLAEFKKYVQYINPYYAWKVVDGEEGFGFIFFLSILSVRKDRRTVAERKSSAG